MQEKQLDTKRKLNHYIIKDTEGHYLVDPLMNQWATDINKARWFLHDDAINALYVSMREKRWDATLVDVGVREY